MSDRSQSLEALYDKLVAALTKRIDGGTHTAADLGVARQLLRDAGIGADPQNPDAATRALLTRLEKLDAEDMANA